ncbi:hypothetical protein J6590_024127 [Homalodisca vitripennis]|nr:hypothetical protein J6590_024127 [Homalodisca vitripennis]
MEPIGHGNDLELRRRGSTSPRRGSPTLILGLWSSPPAHPALRQAESESELPATVSSQRRPEVSFDLDLALGQYPVVRRSGTHRHTTVLVTVTHCGVITHRAAIRLQFLGDPSTLAIHRQGRFVDLDVGQSEVIGKLFSYIWIKCKWTWHEVGSWHRLQWPRLSRSS